MRKLKGDLPSNSSLVADPGCVVGAAALTQKKRAVDA